MAEAKGRNLERHFVELMKGRKPSTCRLHGVPDLIVELKDFPKGEVQICGSAT